MNDTYHRPEPRENWTFNVTDSTELIALSSGARYWKTDIHVHTPASADWPGNPRQSPEGASAVVDAALDRGIEAIAVTDHNTVEGVELVRTAAQGRLVVLPGIEISTPEGHLLAIFDEDQELQPLRELLVKLGFGSDDFGNLNRTSTIDMAKVAEAVNDAGGVAIAAHVSENNGLLRVVQREDVRFRIAATRALAGAEVRSGEQATALARVPNGLGRPLAAMMGSDSWNAQKSQHAFEGIGTLHCWVKMDRPSPVGLQAALLDPGVRIRFQPPSAPANAIEAFEVTHGFFAGAPIRFNDGLTCLIGSTGSGKSLCLEAIRYVLDQRTAVPKLHTETNSLLDGNAAEGSVRLVIRKGEARYLIERSLPRSVGAASAIFEIEDTGALREIEIPSMREFFPIKAYSQSEIIEFAREKSVRLTLLDDLLDLREPFERIRSTKEALVLNGEEQSQLRARVLRIRKDLEQLPVVTEEIAQVEQVLDHEAVRNHQIWERDNRAVRRTTGLIDAFIEEARGRVQGTPQFDTLAQDDSPGRALLSQLDQVTSALSAAVADSRTAEVGVAEGAKRVAAEAASRWDAAFQEESEEYRKAVAALDTKGVGVASLSNRLTALKEQAEKLRGLQKILDETLTEREQSLREDREGLLTAMQQARREITRLRAQKAEQLTAKLERKVILEVKADAENVDFRAQLGELRSGLQRTDLDMMARELHPIPFVKSLVSREFDRLSEISGLEARKFERLADHLSEQPLSRLLDLQCCDEVDAVEVRFEKAPGTYRPIEALAHGEKCAVVLMVAMAEGDCPLLVDQPEDALHPPLIEEQIVGTLRSARVTRQHIFATRNANVVVSGDAEQTVGLTATADKTTVSKTGSIDRFETRDLLLYHLEGGADAFDRKTALYSLGRR